MKHFSLYSPMKDWKKGDYPVSPFVSVGLSDHVEERGEQLLTAELMADSEIDYAVDGLVAELQTLRVKAKAELRKRQQAMLALARADA